ncbi:MAG: histidine--tRNA ligase [Candidatus Njordarchaeia archaeon]
MRYIPPRGFRDFPPEIQILRKRIFSKIEKIFQRYGFDPIETPVLEYYETFKGKYGKETEERLLYRFKDPWSNTWYALRYDLTVPLARFMRNYNGPLPFKRYHIGRVWRHERPQRGRYREFWQADADIVGSKNPEADAEVVNLTIDIMKEFKFTEFSLKLNDRRLLKGIFEVELDIKNPIDVFRSIDKVDKIGIDGVREELQKKGYATQIIEKIVDIISQSGNPEDTLARLQERYKYNKDVQEATSHLLEMFDFITEKNAIRLALDLVRGLDYYTGPIWEVIVKEPKMGSLGGGGRYDELIGIYTGRQLPATGTSIGVERLIDAGIALGIFPVRKETYTQVYVLVMEKSLLQYGFDIVMRLRNVGINAQIDLMRRKEKAQREYANKKNIPVVVFIGKKEFKAKEVTIYDRRTNKRITEKQERLADILKELL